MTRDSLESSIYRHGAIENFSAFLERGEKPAYEAFVQLVRGDIDPSIDPEVTEQLIRQQIESGEFKPEDYDAMVTSPALRARQTAESLTKVTGREVPIHTTPYLREIRFSMDDVTPELYEQASGFAEVRRRYIESFFSGKKIDEGPVDAYHRAERFLTYLRRVKNWTAINPLFISHGAFSRMLRLSIEHQSEHLDDDAIEAMVRAEFLSTPRLGVFTGFKTETTVAGTKIIELP